MSIDNNTSEEENNVCAICLNCKNNISDIKELECKHTFHAICINEWLKVKPECPLCRSIVIVHRSTNSATFSYEETTNQMIVNNTQLSTQVLKNNMVEQIGYIAKNICCCYPVLAFCIFTILSPDEIPPVEKVFFMCMIFVAFIFACSDLVEHIRAFWRLRRAYRGSRSRTISVNV